MEKLFFKNTQQYLDRLHEGPIIIDNFLPDSILDKIEEASFTCLDWNLDCYKGTSNMSEDFLKKGGIKNIYEQFQFNTNGLNNVFANKDGESFHHLKYYHFLSMPLTLALLQMNLWVDMLSILRIKGNFQTRASLDSKDKFNFPHNDLDYSARAKEYWDPRMTTGIFYINDSDGDTCLFKNPPFGSDENKIEDINEYINNLEIDMKISPKRGRLLLFPAFKVHAGCHPIEHANRMVINYNFFPLNNIGVIEKEIFDDVASRK
jgi:hypothetical protein